MVSLRLLRHVEEEDEQHATAGDGEDGERGQDPEHVQQRSHDQHPAARDQERQAANLPGAVVYAWRVSCWSAFQLGLRRRLFPTHVPRCSPHAGGLCLAGKNLLKGRIKPTMVSMASTK